MSITECAILLQTSNSPQTSHQFTKAYAGYFVVALTALVLGFVVLILIRTCARRSTNR
jgi:hypothetical protein